MIFATDAQLTQVFEAEILKLEASVLVDPQIETVRHLHVLSAQLIRLRRSLAPLLRVCYVVRDQDVQRTQAATALAGSARALDRGHTQRESGYVAPGSELAGAGLSLSLSRPETPGMSDFQIAMGGPGGGEHHHHGQTHQIGHNASSSATGQRSAPSPTPSAGGTIRSAAMTNNATNASTGGNGNGAGVLGKELPGVATGYFSPLTKVYIGDVLDHLELIISSMDQFVASCDHLTDYVFVSGLSLLHSSTPFHTVRGQRSASMTSPIPVSCGETDTPECNDLPVE